MKKYGLKFVTVIATTVMAGQSFADSVNGLVGLSANSGIKIHAMNCLPDKPESKPLASTIDGSLFRSSFLAVVYFDVCAELSTMVSSPQRLSLPLLMDENVVVGFQMTDTSGENKIYLSKDWLHRRDK